LGSFTEYLFNNFVCKTSNTRHTINNENVICPAVGCQKKAGTPAAAGVVTSKTTVNGGYARNIKVAMQL
jgi:hypothetical protein